MVKPALDLQDRYGYPLRPSSHFFRNTFAKEVETGKVRIDQLATLLGDNPATVREHYFKVGSRSTGRPGRGSTRKLEDPQAGH
ncbi:MAG: hypothetical protein WB607_16710 [Candidatus Acidiferrum sp.]